MKFKKIITLVLTLSMVLSSLVIFTISGSAVMPAMAYVGEDFVKILSNKLSEEEVDGNVKEFSLCEDEGYATGTLDVKANPDDASQTMITICPATTGLIQVDYLIYEESRSEWTDHCFWVTSYAVYQVGTTFTHKILKSVYGEVAQDGYIKEITAENANVKSVVQNGDDIDITLEATQEGIITLYYFYYDSGDADWFDMYEKVGKVIPPSENLDLESTETYDDKKTIDQNYTFIQDSEEFTDVTKVTLEWAVSELEATYKSHKTWSPTEMKWVEAKEDISAADLTATFKLTNYSSKNVKANVSFAVEDSLKDTFDATNTSFANNDCVVKTPVTQAKEAYETSDFTALTETITATLKFNTSAFTSLKAATDSTTYGTYTITITTAPNGDLMTFTEQTYGASGITVVQNSIVLKGTTWSSVVANNENNSITISCAGYEFTLQLQIATTKDHGEVVMLIDADQSLPLYLYTADSSTAVQIANSLRASDNVTGTLFFSACPEG